MATKITIALGKKLADAATKCHPKALLCGVLKQRNAWKVSIFIVANSVIVDGVTVNRAVRPPHALANMYEADSTLKDAVIDANVCVQVLTWTPAEYKRMQGIWAKQEERKGDDTPCLVFQHKKDVQKKIADYFVTEVEGAGSDDDASLSDNFNDDGDTSYDATFDGYAADECKCSNAKQGAAKQGAVKATVNVTSSTVPLGRSNKANTPRKKSAKKKPAEITASKRKREEEWDSDDESVAPASPKLTVPKKMGKKKARRFGEEGDPDDEAGYD